MALILAFGIVRSAYCSVPVRPLSGMAASTEFELCGTLLFAREAGENFVYVPQRRRGASAWDEGRIVKYRIADDGSLMPIWASTVPASRVLLAPPTKTGAFTSGQLRPFFDDLPLLAQAAGLDEDTARRLGVFYQKKAQGAPYPTAFVLVKDTLYTQGDDGLISAFGAGDGVERWAALLPHMLTNERAGAVLSAGAVPPWLTAGGLTAEKCEISDTDERVLLWGTLGAAGRGIYCLDVDVPAAPAFHWAREETSTGADVFWSCADDQALRAGFTAAAPVVPASRGGQTLLLPSGAGVSGRLWALDAAAGSVQRSCPGGDGISFKFSPLALQSARGELTRLIVADEAGGVQEFVCSGDYFAWQRRLDLRQISGADDLDLLSAPLLCPLAGENWLAFIGAASEGTVVTACPLPLRERLWSDLPWRGGGWGWYHIYEGFHSVVSAAFFDGLLYLSGTEDGRAVVKIIDITGQRFEKTQELPQKDSVLLVVDGQVIALGNRDGALSATTVTALGFSSSSVLYTLFH